MNKGDYIKMDINGKLCEDILRWTEVNHTSGCVERAAFVFIEQG